MAKRKTETLVLGLALFAMFFGAGNLIFPPAIGLKGGRLWPLGYLFYFIMDVGLAVVSILAMLTAGGDMGKITAPLGRRGAKIFNLVMIVAVGPLIAIPRTAATTFDMGISNLMPDTWWSLPLFSIIFFAVVLFLCLKDTGVVDIIGKILTPVLVAALAVLIIAGIIHPDGTPATPMPHLVREGISNGYQTMDMIAALAFSMLIVTTIKNAGYADARAERIETLKASGVAAGLLFLVYGGLAYLGATTGTLWRQTFLSGRMNQAELLMQITGHLLGHVGAVVITLIVTFACLTTAIGLVSSCSKFFVSALSTSKHAISYRKTVIVVCVLAAVLCNLGLNQIIRLASPVLSVIYPAGVFLTVTYLLPTRNLPKPALCAGAVTALVVSLLTTLHDNLHIGALSFAAHLPLSSFGFGWLIPAAIVTVIALLMIRQKPSAPASSSLS